MKAVIWTAYGPPEVLELQETATPVAKDDEILVRIHATTVETGDCEVRRYQLHNWLYLPLRFLTGLIRPRIKILGQQLSGTVSEVGKAVTQFKVGDEVFAPFEMVFGSYAEYATLPEKGVITRKPDNISHAEAAAIAVGGANALHFLRKGEIQPGQKVLIYGTTGSIGTFAVQLAKYFGATVHGVCGPTNVELVKSLGAEKVFDYTKNELEASSEEYDIIFDTIGKCPYPLGLKRLKPDGFYLLANPTLREQLRGMWTSLTSGKKIRTELAKYHREDMAFLSDLVEAGELKIIIDRTFPLEDAVEAHRYVEKGHKKGNVVLTVIPDSE